MIVKPLIVVFLIGLFFSALSTLSVKKSFKKYPDVYSWSKPDKKFWLGLDYKCYKLGPDNILETSDDFSNWRPASDSIWKDRFDHKMCVSQNKLMISLNDIEWEEIPDKTWQSIDGNWYRFDDNLVLYKSSANPDLVAGR